MKTKSFFPIVNRFRFALLRAAAKLKLRGVIVTSGWAVEEKNLWIEGLKRIGRERGNELYFVHLYDDEREHLKRVRGETRKLFKKSRNATEVKADRLKHDFSKPHSKTAFSLDSTKLSSRASAKAIKKHYSF